MNRVKNTIRQLEEVLMEIFKVLSFGMAICVVLLVEAWGIIKVWGIVFAERGKG